MRRLVTRALESLGGGSPGHRLLVLIYHRVLPAPDPLYPNEPDARRFRLHMATLRTDFNVVPLREAIERLRRDDLPPRSVAVTFDDGFRDNAEVAAPILAALGIPATFFVATGYLGGGWMFNDGVIEACRRVQTGTWHTGVPELGTVEVRADVPRGELALRLIYGLRYLDAGRRLQAAATLLETARAAAPSDLMMTPDQVRALRAAGHDIGGHTVSHPILARLSDEEAAAEIGGGRRALEDILGEPVRLFAYPNGVPDRDYGPRDVALVRDAGFEAAVTTAWGYADAGCSAYEVPRIGSWDAQAWRFSARLALARARHRGTGCRDPQEAGAPVVGEGVRHA
jgi:peptidoglycan/xylan/chitin deacetylase (PgdA/CDA1 family)